MAKKPIIRYFDRGVWYDATVSDIGNLEDLNTVHKTTVVEAINDIVGGDFTISGNLLDRLNGLDESIGRLDEMITNGSLNENQAEQINQFVVGKLNELSQSMEELNKQRDQRLKEQEEKVAQLKLDSESDRQRIEEITGDLNATKEKLNNAELNVTSVTQLVDEINGKISQAVSKTDFDLLEGTVREQKTLIDQTAEGIKLLATKEELDKANENVKSIKSELEVQAGLIESKVSSEQLINEMEKIDKYMPNLLRYTRNWQDWENDDEANIDVTLNEYRDCIIQRARGIGKGLSTTVEDLVIGETYSLSVWVKHDDTNAKLYAMVDNEEIIMTDLNSKETFVNNEFKRMRCSFVAQDTTAKVRFIFKNCRTDSYGYLAGAKCEKNKKVSGWQPNSEDVYQSIKSARSEIKQTDDKITTLVGTVTKQGDLISSHTTSIEETDKAIKLQAESIKTLNESIESTKAELKVSSDAIKSKVWKTDVGEMISDINIDNKNRVLNSDFGDGWELWSETNNLFQLKQIGNYKFAVAERSGLSQNMAIAIATNKFTVKHNERLMFGFYFYCADLSKLDNKIIGALELLDINDIRIDRVDFDVSKLSLGNGSFTKLTDTYFVEDERIVKARLRFFLNRNGNIGFALPMAQAGDIKSSDWSLAPEDVARRFNDTNVTITNYEQTVDGFRQTVESYKGSVDGYSSQVSEFNQTVNGFSQTVKDYKESNDKRVQQLESSLTTEAGKIEAVVKESAGTKDELEKLTADGGRISQLELTAQGFSTTVGEITKSVNRTNERIDNINIGGKNLFVDAGFKKEVRITNDYDTGYWYSYVGTKFNYPKFDDDCNYLYFTANNDNALGVFQLFDTNKLTKGQTYSVRTQVKVDQTTTFRYQLAKKNPDNSYKWYFNFSDTTVNTIGEWVDVKWTFTIPKDDDGVEYGVVFRNLLTGTNATIQMLKPKLEIGNMYTGFSLAPEDQQSQIDNINNNLREQYMTIEQSNSWIEQKKDSIVQGVSQSVETIGNRLDNLQVGGRNLLRHSDVSTKNLKYFHAEYTTAEVVADGNIKAYKISAVNNTNAKGVWCSFNDGIKNLLAGRTYTYSFWLKSSMDDIFAFDSIGHYQTRTGVASEIHVSDKQIYKPSTIKANVWTKVSVTFYVTKDCIFYPYFWFLQANQVIYVYDIMLEEGNTPTPWSPAPDDQQAQIDGINNNLRDNYYNKTTVDSMLKVDGQGITTYVKSTKSQLDNLSVGGRNLLFKTGYFDTSKLSGVIGDSSKINLSKTIITDANSPSGKAYRINKYKKGTENVYGGCYWSMPKKLVAGKKYTWSVYVRGVGTVDAFGPEQGGHKSVKLTDTWTKVSHTFTANSNQYFQFVFYSNTEFDLYLTDLMLEEGTMPSPWSPAPEDYNDKIDGVSGNLDDLDKKIGEIDTWKTEVAESFITQTANSLSTLIKDKNGASLMHFDSTSSTWSFNTSTLEKNISDAKTAGTNAQTTANNANDLANKLNNAIRDIQNKTAYITMTTYQGKPCIELGKTDNKFKVRITNESVDFLDGSTRVAYVSNNQLYIEKAMVKNEFQIGEGTGFVWKKRSNGNMGLRWGG